jgi:hypothetical protein
LKWLNDATFEMDGYKITLDYEYGGSKRLSKVADFTMMKSRGFLDEYIEHQKEDFRRVLELGVYQGGSFVFLDRLFKPEKISAIELSAFSIPALDVYVNEHSDRARVYYGTSQDDVSRLNRIIEQDFGGELDFVVDDASHFYEPTRTSFKTIFPKVRPGGLYIIEDWPWSFQDSYQEAGHSWSQMNSLANLAIDFMEDMVLGNMIAEVRISPSMMKIRRSGAKNGAVFAKVGRRGREYKLL